MHASQVRRVVVRMANNCTARLNVLPPAKNKGRPCEFGQRVRPLPRMCQGKPIPATPAHQHGSFVVEGRTLHYETWLQLVALTTPVAPDNRLFSIHAFSDSWYDKPLLLATDISLAPELIFLIYRDRWPSEE